jgi:hypothetical protein
MAPQSVSHNITGLSAKDFLARVPPRPRPQFKRFSQAELDRYLDAPPEPDDLAAARGIALGALTGVALGAWIVVAWRLLH